MAGPTPGTATGLLGGTAASVDNGTPLVKEYDSGQCYYYEIWVDVATDASSTDGVDVAVKRKTGSSGTDASSGLTKSVAATEAKVLYMGIYDAGTVDIVVTNNDASYAATVNEIYVRTAT